jgi:GT2 family glycosyltransferase
MAAQPALFSVVIPTCNEGEMLHMTVDSILQQTAYPNVEVIIVDDGSTDGSCDQYRDTADPVTVVSGENLGVPLARNLGADHAQGEYVVFLDAHCTVSPNWLDLFSEALAQRNVAIVGPSFSRLEEPEPRGCGMTWVNHQLHTAWIEPQDVKPPYEVPFTPGGCQAFRLSTFKAIGRFDEGLTKWGYQDIELCLRAWLLGYRVVVNPDIRVAHYFRDKRSFDVPDQGVLYNFLRVIHKHFSSQRIRRCIRAIDRYPNLEKTIDQLYESDIFVVRAQMEAARVHDDDWFFRAFIPELR